MNEFISNEDVIEWEDGVTTISAANLNKINSATATALNSLNSDVENLIEGAQTGAVIVERAYKDGEGNNIANTYVKKASIIAPTGTLEVSKAVRGEADYNGNNIASTYATQNGTYNNMTVGYAERANFAGITAYTSMPSASDNSLKIAPTSWVHNLLGFRQGNIVKLSDGSIVGQIYRRFNRVYGDVTFTVTSATSDTYVGDVVVTVGSETLYQIFRPTGRHITLYDRTDSNTSVTLFNLQVDYYSNRVVLSCSNTLSSQVGETITIKFSYEAGESL